MADVFETYPFPVVCIVIARVNDAGEREILIQKRTKTRNQVDYKHLWELPQGKIRAGEPLLSAIARELYEETTLSFENLNAIHNLEKTKILDADIESFQPTICVIDLKNNYIGLGIVTNATGVASDTSEASEHKWVSKPEVLTLIAQGIVFPLNVPIIQRVFEEL